MGWFGVLSLFVVLVKLFFSGSHAFFAQRLSSRLVASLCFVLVGKLKCWFIADETIVVL